MEIEKLGGNVYEGLGHFNVVGNKKDYVNNLKKFLKNNYYEIIHIHSGSIFALAPTDLADGTYPVKVVYKQTQVLSLLFN